MYFTSVHHLYISVLFLGNEEAPEIEEEAEEVEELEDLEQEMGTRFKPALGLSKKGSTENKMKLVSAFDSTDSLLSNGTPSDFTGNSNCIQIY